MTAEEVEETQAADTTETEPTEPTEKSDETSGIDNLEDAKKVIEKLRKEAASRRIKGKELEEKAQKWQEYVDSQKTELERALEKAATLEKQLESEKVERMRAKIVAETGLDPDLSELLVGSEKEMRKRAEQLVEKLGNKRANSDFYAGQRGRKAAPKAQTFNDFMMQLWKEADTKSSRTTL